MNDLLMLPAELTIYTVAELRPLWLQWLDDHATVADSAPRRMHGGAVAEVDGAGLQLVMALARSLHDRHTSLEIVEPSTRFVAACEALGATAMMASHTAEPA